MKTTKRVTRVISPSNDSITKKKNSKIAYDYIRSVINDLTTEIFYNRKISTQRAKIPTS